MLPEIAEGRRGGEAGALEALVRIAVHEGHRRLEPEARVDASHAGESLARDEAHRFRILHRRVGSESEAHIAARTTVKRLRLVAEVAQDGVVTAGAALRPADQLEEEAPLVLDHHRVCRGALGPALDEGTAEGKIPRRDEEETESVRAVPARAPHLLVVGLDRAGRP